MLLCRQRSGQQRAQGQVRAAAGEFFDDFDSSTPALAANAARAARCAAQPSLLSPYSRVLTRRQPLGLMISIRRQQLQQFVLAAMTSLEQ